MFHELGHNHQWNPSRLPGTTETTCNFASVYLMEDLVGLDLGHSALSPQQRHQRMESYFQGGADIDDWSVWTALDTYLIIKEEWGWAPITQALTTYYTLPPSEVPDTDEEEFNSWVLHISSASGYNLAPYHEAWGFPLYPSPPQTVSQRSGMTSRSRGIARSSTCARAYRHAPPLARRPPNLRVPVEPLR